MSKSGTRPVRLALLALALVVVGALGVSASAFGRSNAKSCGTVTMDDAYIRESILQPGARITAGFQPIMPTFQGVVNEEQLLELVEYVKTLKTDVPPSAARPAPTGPAPGENTPARREAPR